MAEQLSVLMTGSKGFIGSHLAPRLLSLGWRVVEWEGDVRAVGGFTQPVDVVLHLAAVSRHDAFAAEPHEAFDVNVTGTLAVLNYCKKMGARPVLASTSGVYGEPEGNGQLSEDAPIGTRSPYAISKWLAENLCRRYAEDMEVASVVLRLFNVYGPGQHPSFLVPYVVDCLAGSKPITLRMPNAVRDFVYVEDVVDAMTKVIGLHAEGFKVFNIGSAFRVSVMDIVRQAEEIFGKAVAISATDPHGGEPSAVVADNTRARRELGWSPKWDLKAGLAMLRAPSDVARMGL